MKLTDLEGWSERGHIGGMAEVYQMPPLRPGMLEVTFFARPSHPMAWPASWTARFEGSLAGAVTIAKGTLDQNVFPAAVRFEVSDYLGRVVGKWPESDDA